ncbi:MAG: Hpt domain-containing protein, partial [Methylococcaceae bacterium]|nr:Hpt domain-containing protein [Methylococcaceae bacterium]
RLDGERGLYGRICRQFIQEQSDASQQIADLLAQGLGAEVRRLAHSLKGLAATLGAVALAKAAAKFEAAINQGVAPVELNAYLDRIHEALTLSLPELQRLADRFDPPRTMG